MLWVSFVSDRINIDGWCCARWFLICACLSLERELQFHDVMMLLMTVILMVIWGGFVAGAFCDRGTGGD